jgi:hypothetical protein
MRGMSIIKAITIEAILRALFFDVMKACIK